MEALNVVLCLLLAFSLLLNAKQRFTIIELNELVKDKNAKYHGMLHYFNEKTTAEKKNNKK